MCETVYDAQQFCARVPSPGAYSITTAYASCCQGVLESSAGDAYEEDRNTALDVEKEEYEEDLDEIDDDGELDG